MKKALIILLIIYLFMQLYLPGMAEDKIRQGLMANIDQEIGRASCRERVYTKV